MRISADEQDPGYAAYRAMQRIGVSRFISVYLDGVQLEGQAYTADDAEGIVVVADLDDEGRYQDDGTGRVLTKTLRGKVEIRMDNPERAA